MRMRDHWRYALRTTIPRPMGLLYLKTNRLFLGFVTSVEQGDQRFKSLYTRSFTMQLTNPNGMNPHGASESGRLAEGSVPRVPTARDVFDRPNGWFTEDELANPGPTQTGRDALDGARGIPE